MTSESARLAGPVATLGFVLMPTFRTAAGRSPFRTAEARNAGLFALVRQIVDVATVLPLRHALIVVTSAAPVPDAIRIADVEAGYLIRLTEVDDLPRSFVPTVPDAPFGAQGIAIADAVELLPTPRTFGTKGHLRSKGTVHLIHAPLLGADAAAGHDQTLSGVGGNGALVDLPEIDRRLGATGAGGFNSRLDGNVQLAADPVPDNLAGGWLREPFRPGQHDGFAATPHRQDDPVAIERHRLRGPQQGILNS